MGTANSSARAWNVRLREQQRIASPFLIAFAAEFNLLCKGRVYLRTCQSSDVG